MRRRVSDNQAFTRSNFAVKRRNEPSRSAGSGGEELFDNLDGETLLTAEELATRLRVATWTIRKWRYEKYLPPDTMVKLRHGVRYKWTNILHWLGKQQDLP
jgi:hypothetical protein